MPEKTNRVEPHGCIVCGKIHSLLVVYTPAGNFLECAVISPEAMVIPDPKRPLVACMKHSPKEIDRALTLHYPGMEQPQDLDEG
jgi:hypothetical protein